MTTSAPNRETEISANQVLTGNSLEILKTWPDKCVDLVLCSPPYENARSYGIDFDLSGQEWVDWAAELFRECVRVCRGLTCWIVEGRTKQFRYSATPMLLAADLHRSGVKLRKPPIYHRVGIPGSGGPDGLRNDYEFCICASHGRLPWSDNTACGKPPKYAPGGAPSHRKQNGERVEGDYKPPKLANPGNVIQETYTASHVAAILNAKTDELGDVIKGSVGGGLIGHVLAHANEAPFPEWLAEFYVRSFCPPDGIAVDIFGGSGTTAAIAWTWGRRYISIDIRQSQSEVTQKRLADTTRRLDFMTGRNGGVTQ